MGSAWSRMTTPPPASSVTLPSILAAIRTGSGCQGWSVDEGIGVAAGRAVAATDCRAEGLAVGAALAAGKSGVVDGAVVAAPKPTPDGEAEALDVDPEAPSIRRGTCHTTTAASATHRTAATLRWRLSSGRHGMSGLYGQLRTMAGNRPIWSRRGRSLSPGRARSAGYPVPVAYPAAAGLVTGRSRSRRRARWSCLTCPLPNT